jgi:hypothetical protein
VSRVAPSAVADGGQPQPGWWAVALTGGDYQDNPCLTIYREDDAGMQRRLTVVDLAITPGVDDADLELSRQGWRRQGDWEQIGDDGATAQISRTNGRPPDGSRAETKLWLDDLVAVDALIGVHGRGRSQVLAYLIRRGLESEDDQTSAPR